MAKKQHAMRDVFEKIDFILLAKEANSLDDVFFQAKENESLTEKDERENEKRKYMDNFNNWKSDSKAMYQSSAEKTAEYIIKTGCLLDSISKQKIITCDIEYFLSNLKKEYQNIITANKKNNNYLALPSPSWFNPFGSRVLFMPMLLEHYKKPDFKKALSDGYVPQRFLYCDHLATSNWRNLITAPDSMSLYRGPEFCLSALQNFIKSSLWHDFIADGSINNVFMLGGGTPNKDVAILNSFWKSDNIKDKYRNHNKIDYVIVDSSPFMLVDTILKMESDFTTDLNNISEISNTITIVANFLKMSRILMALKDFDNIYNRPSNQMKKSAFFITGGTFSNLSEKKFIQSIKSVAKKGDYLIIGIEFVDDKNIDNYIQQLEIGYNHKYIKNFYVPHVQDIYYANTNGNISSFDAEKSINIYIDRHSEHINEDGLKVTRSDIVNTISAVVEADIGGKKVTLLNASRYRKDEFKKFIEGEGFRLVEFFESNGYKQYFQAVFEYVEEYPLKSNS